MKKLILITVLLLSASLFTRAQDTTRSKAQPDSIIKVIPFGEGTHTAHLYTIGGKLQTPEDVKMRLLSYAPSAAEYNLAKSNITWGYISFTGFVASGTGAAIAFAKTSKFAGETTALVNGQPTFIYQHHNKTAAYILTGVATAFLTTAIIKLVHSGRHGNRALKLYNQRFE
ncbi:hypothetical protein [Mucilaginibacter xinganensis]|uniref:Uncharacterized protein n=1 Tax=Mucilaginibacter xinganensis TaxID=1234841 RepID=A0A223NT83_9SPHI|nr:hypothetical protein [Mucilaginibacter xinganensis]ASU32711.1 hypothetical protein MuYL_0811 [Mucilaginibacter xinganensis]